MGVDGYLTIKEAHISFHAHNGVKDVILEKWPHSDSLSFARTGMR